jgi:hypothetical protein
MTTRERLHKLVDELSEAEADDALNLIASRSKNDAVDADPDTSREPPEMASAPESWGWDKTAWGAPMPNVVAWVDRSRQGR